MKINPISTKVLAFAIGCALAAVSSLHATTNNYSIGINFGSDQRAEDPTGVNPIVANDPNTGLSSALAATDLAGVPGVRQRNWNNALDANGTGWSGTYATPSVVAGLVADTNDVAVGTTSSVEWQANGTWATSGYRGLAENNATNMLVGTSDNLLMAGYLDVTGAATPTLIRLRNLPSELTSGGYHVYVYSLGGARANRGGSIRITDTNGIIRTSSVRRTTLRIPEPVIPFRPTPGTITYSRMWRGLTS